ncbi:hypothetical protein A9486_20795 [Bacillus anthracis]|nr:hypothetical protein A9486_20795 [Bacillus anthracis]
MGKNNKLQKKKFWLGMMWGKGFCYSFQMELHINILKHLVNLKKLADTQRILSRRTKDSLNRNK